MRAPITFHDSYWYCYANCTAMLLSSTDERVSPRLIEALSAVGLGAFMKEGLPFFGQLATPDKGISQALRLLGFAFVEAAAEIPGREPFDQLETLLREGPAILGPLDMMHLSYNPTRPTQPGVDHYVLAYRLDGDRVHLHDPAGFAHVFIDRPQLMRAWLADTVPYHRGHYRYWTAPLRSTTPSPAEIYEAAIDTFQQLYRQAEQRVDIDKALIGRHALLALAELVTTASLSEKQRNHLTHFALPLGAKRALDYANFFAGHHASLQKLKLEQAIAFGACLTQLVAANWISAGVHLKKLAEIETEIEDAILRT
jgi:hypothetical protein